jgi:porin
MKLEVASGATALRTTLLLEKYNFPPRFVPLGTPPCKPEHSLEFNTLLDVAPMLLLQPVVQYYANIGGRSQHAVVFGFRTKVAF